jgi:predicted glycogen debranching enzyme
MVVPMIGAATRRMHRNASVRDGVDLLDLRTPEWMEGRDVISADISNSNLEGLLNREWLVTNGLGGYASSTVCGLNTRKYHGLLVAAMSPPVRRMVLLSHVEEAVFNSSGRFELASNEYPGTIHPQGFRLMRAFSVEPFPRWAFQGDGFTLEKSLTLLQGENSVCLSYSLLTGEKSVTLEVAPMLALRSIHELMYQWNSRLAPEPKGANLVRIPASSRTPEVFFAHKGDFRPDVNWYLNTIYRREDERGYSGLEDLWKPGTFRFKLSPGQTVHLVCSTDPTTLEHVCREMDRARADFDRLHSPLAEPREIVLDRLLHAAGQFVVNGGANQEQQVPQVIAQYPWAPPCARAALVGFSGLFLIPGRLHEARALLLGLAGQLRGGLIPTDFSEQGNVPVYSGADVSLWFINAVGELLNCGDDEAFLRQVFPAIQQIIDAYRHGAGLGIGSDHDGLVFSRDAGVPTTWMDAKIADWVITPRQGRPVELNALWYNALKIGAQGAAKLGRESLESDWQSLAARVKSAFNERFWNDEIGCCFDVVEDHGNDPAVRPNQIFAVSLPHAVLAPERHVLVVQQIVDSLVTDFGVRTVAPTDPGYQGRYKGNVVSRDRAQHQGSAYPWLFGPLVKAYLRAYGRNEVSIAKVRGWVQPCLDRLQGDGLGQINELFDGDAPHQPGGAIASALSTAELLRCYAEDVLGLSPEQLKSTSAATSAMNASLQTGNHV